MRGTRLHGKTIARVYQTAAQLRDADGDRTWCINAIEFTDGSVLRFIVAEGDADHAVMGIYPARAIDDADRRRYA